LAIIGLYYYILKRKQSKLKNYYKYLPQKSTYRFFDYEKTSSLKLKTIGKSIASSGTKKIIFLHGTFVGDDPLDILHGIKALYPNISSKYEDKVKEFYLKKIDFMAKDLGNFPDKMIKDFAHELENQIITYNFTWSSSNHHLARVKGCLELLLFINNIQDDKDSGILLIGHSHAGQLFALLTQILAKRSIRNEFLKVAKVYDYELIDLNESIRKLSKLNIDFVTMGTPPRYEFKLKKNFRLLHLINHRGERPFAGELTGALFSKDGDYLQQLAIAGSDTPPLVAKDRVINSELDSLLGSGADLSIWKENIKQKRRVHGQGMNYLIDYKDSSTYPNGIKTIFGHGIYTKKEVMNYNFKMIVQYLYS
jgi:hypothetical protein